MNLEEQQKKLLEKLEDSEQLKKHLVLNIDSKNYMEMVEKILAFKQTCKPLLESQTYARVVELLDAKKTLEDYGLMLKEAELALKNLEQNNIDVYTNLHVLLSSLDSNFTALLNRLNNELDQQQIHREREKITLKNIDLYIKQFT